MRRIFSTPPTTSWSFPTACLPRHSSSISTVLDETHGVTIAIKLLPIRPPAAMEQLLGTVLLSSNRILRNPAPLVAIKGLDSHAIDVELSFRVHDAGQACAATNEIYDLIYRHTQAADVPLSATDLIADTTGLAKVRISA